jgi:hypothetical protein
MSRCVICGCTEAQACPDGCGWLIKPGLDGLGLCDNARCLDAALRKLTAFKKLRGAKMPARRRR